MDPPPNPRPWASSTRRAGGDGSLPTGPAGFPHSCHQRPQKAPGAVTDDSGVPSAPGGFLGTGLGAAPRSAGPGDRKAAGGSGVTPRSPPQGAPTAGTARRWTHRLGLHRWLHLGVGAPDLPYALTFLHGEGRRRSSEQQCMNPALSKAPGLQSKAPKGGTAEGAPTRLRTAPHPAQDPPSPEDTHVGGVFLVGCPLLGREALRRQRGRSELSRSTQQPSPGAPFSRSHPAAPPFPGGRRSSSGRCASSGRSP